MSDICELCGSQDGEVYPAREVPKYGNSGDIARAMFPQACKCICKNCKSILKKHGEKMDEMVKKRREAREIENDRRAKNKLCYECGGEIQKSGPYMVYEGTYETRYRCQQCGKGWAYT